MAYTALYQVAWVLTVGVLASGCGAEDGPAGLPAGAPEPPGENEEVEPVAEPPIEGAVEVSIEGRARGMGAQASLHVVEGESEVGLTITGADGAGVSDFVYIDITFDGVAGSMGPHTFQFGLPAQAAHVANLGLDGEQYYSQGGAIEVSLSADGAIEGTFSVALARDLTALGPAGVEPVFAPSDEEILVSGSFSGDWRLSCQSKLPGHNTLVVGGDYCDALEF